MRPGCTKQPGSKVAKATGPIVKRMAERAVQSLLDEGSWTAVRKCHLPGRAISDRGSGQTVRRYGRVPFDNLGRHAMRTLMAR